MFSRVFFALFGLAMAVAPRKSLRPVEQVLLSGYENPEALEPKEWYLDAIRAKGVLIFVAAVVTIALERRGAGKQLEKELKAWAETEATKLATANADEDASE
ncbi:hypothetical protein [Natronomonas sp. EA1]|uniref:hypothetical protein n=1 Tax=Natronomonas sp. EA1 TaxID=3421655 RepID=UPI003EBCE591